MREKDWYISFGFDCKGEPPRVEICGPDGVAWVEVHEEPVLKPSRGEPCESADSGLWSREPDDWEPGPVAAQVLALMQRGIEIE